MIERVVRNDEVSGLIPLRSTIIPNSKPGAACLTAARSSAEKIVERG